MTAAAIVLILLGLGISVFATSLVIRPTGWSRATGTIIGLSDSAPSWAPYRGASFRYTSDDGTEHTIWSPDATGGTGDSEVGGPVQVRYDPKNPADARAAAPLPRIFILVGIGDLLLVAGILVLFL
jgi:hypothetical protein